MSLPINLHCYVSRLIARPGTFVIADDDTARLLGAPTGLLHITVLFHSETEMQVWQDMLQEHPEAIRALGGR